MTSINLKPCPFCGNRVSINKLPLWNETGGYKGCYEYDISCKNCRCSIFLGSNNTIYNSDEGAIKEAVDHWNKRSEE